MADKLTDDELQHWIEHTDGQPHLQSALIELRDARGLTLSLEEYELLDRMVTSAKGVLSPEDCQLARMVIERFAPETR